MLVTDGKLPFTAEDLRRVRAMLDQESIKEKLVKVLSGEQKEEEEVPRVPPEVQEYADSVGRRAMIGTTLLDMDPVSAFAQVFIMGLEMGVEMERTKPDSDKVLTLNLGFSGAGGNA